MKENFRYEQTYDSKKKRNIQDTVEFILSLDYGTTIENNKLAKILGYNITTEIEYRKFKQLMIKVKNFLLQYGYVLKSIAGVGYYILKPSQISKHCYKTYIKTAGRLYDKSYYVLNRIDQSHLSKIRKEELDDVINLNKQLMENADKIFFESTYYDRKAYYDSLLEDDKDNKEG